MYLVIGLVEGIFVFSSSSSSSSSVFLYRKRGVKLHGMEGIPIVGLSRYNKFCSYYPLPTYAGGRGFWTL